MTDARSSSFWSLVEGRGAPPPAAATSGLRHRRGEMQRVIALLGDRLPAWRTGRIRRASR